MKITPKQLLEYAIGGLEAGDVCCVLALLKAALADIVKQEGEAAAVNGGDVS